MAVISISIEESEEQIIAGFPKSVSIETNIAANIFYTLDGSEPSVLSNIYIGTLKLPTNVLNLTLKVFATDGVDSSSVVTKEYSTNILNNTRLPHSTGNDVDTNNVSLFPFGDNNPDPNITYQNPANAGTTVFNPSLPVYPFGYDGEGNPISANQPLNTYQNVYSTTDRQGKVYPDVGNLPGKVTILGKSTPTEYTPQESSKSSALFNPKAMVIFQDTTTDDPSNPVQLNGQFYTSSNMEIVDNGARLYANSFTDQAITGAFLRSHYNPRTQMVTSYYRDSATNRWIISTAPYEPKQSDPGNLSSMVFPKNSSGCGFVFQWHLFRYRTLS